MGKKGIIRTISIVMFVVAFVWVWICALCPTLWINVTVFGHELGLEEVRLFYKLYVIVMIVLFVVSFFVKGKKKS